jgi:hypothetical protein
MKSSNTADLFEGEDLDEEQLFALDFVWSDRYYVGKEKMEKDPTLTEKPKQALKGLMIKRAVENLKNIIKSKQEGPKIEHAKKQGLCSEKLWASFTEGMMDLKQELQDMKKDANELEPGWGDKGLMQVAEQIVMKEFREKQKAKQAEMTPEQRRAAFREHKMRQVEQKKAQKKKDTAEQQQKLQDVDAQARADKAMRKYQQEEAALLRKRKKGNKNKKK